MAEFILNKQALKSAEDLTTPTTVAKYGLGFEIETVDENNDVRKYIYVKNGSGALTAADCVVVTPSFVIGTPATAAFTVLGGVANVGVAANAYFFLQIKGKTVATTAGAVTATHTGKLTNTNKTVTDESGTAQTAKTFCVIDETLGAAGKAAITLFGIGQQI